MTDHPAEPVDYSVSVRNLCAFAAKAGDLDLRFTPSPTAQQGREGHMLVAQRRAPPFEAEVSLSGIHKGLRVRGRADGFDPQRNALEEIKTFRGNIDAIAANHRALHWAQLKVYGCLMCQSRGMSALTLSLVYFNVADQTEYPLNVECDAAELQLFFEDLCEKFLQWARQEQAHRRGRNAALERLEFPQKPFRPGQRTLAGAVYRTCLDGRPLLVQAPTGIGKTLGTLFPSLRAMPEGRLDKIYFLTAKTPGRQVALDALRTLRRGDAAGGALPLRVVELVARDKACEHQDKACHGESCPLARGFYDRLPAARQAAADAAWLDRQQLRTLALHHGICPYYLGQEMLRWGDVVVGDYNYYFDRTAILHSMMLEDAWRVAVLVDEAHNLYTRACGMYSATLGYEDTHALVQDVPRALRAALAELTRQWLRLQSAPERDAQEPPGRSEDDLHRSRRRRYSSEPPQAPWRLLEQPPGDWMAALQKFNGAAGDYFNTQPPAAKPGSLLGFYFRTLAFAGLADEFGPHSLCELVTAGAEYAGTSLTLRNIVPGHFIAQRLHAAQALVLFSATLNPPDYYVDLLGLSDGTRNMQVPSPFQPEQLAVRIQPVSTRRQDRQASLDKVVDTMAQQFHTQPGNYLAFFSSFDYLEMAWQRFQHRFSGIAVWAQARQMDEAARDAFLHRFDAAGQGVGFAVLGGVFAEGVDLPGKRLVGAFVATLGLPQFDAVNQAICERIEQRFGRGHDYTYVFPGLQKVVQAAGRVIRSETDTGAVILLDERYLEKRYQALLPDWWNIQSV